MICDRLKILLNELDIDEEVKQLAQQYSLLNDSDRELIKKMIDSLAEKSKSSQY